LEAIRHVGGMIARAACPPIVPSDIERRAAGNALMCLDLAPARTVAKGGPGAIDDDPQLPQLRAWVSA
jgi:hypothetical protein